MTRERFDKSAKEYEKALEKEMRVHSEAEDIYRNLLNERNQELCRILKDSGLAVCTNFDLHVGSFFPNQPNEFYINELRKSTTDKKELLGLFPINQMKLVSYKVEKQHTGTRDCTCQKCLKSRTPQYEIKNEFLCPFHRALLISKMGADRITRDLNVSSVEIWGGGQNKLNTVVRLRNNRSIFFTDSLSSDGRAIVVDDQIYSYFGLGIARR